jgi:hypothetical protein
MRAKSGKDDARILRITFGCDLLVYPRDQDRSTIAYTVELVEVSYREVVGFRAP